MSTVNMHEAKTHFSKIEPPPSKRVAGRDRGLFTVPDDFDAPLPAP